MATETDTTVIVRAARALYEAQRPVSYRRDCTQPDLPPVKHLKAQLPWEELSDGTKQYLIDQVSAVLQAIREPSEAMISAAWEHRREDDDHSRLGEEPLPEDAWPAMIDAALEEG